MIRKLWVFTIPFGVAFTLFAILVARPAHQGPGGSSGFVAPAYGQSLVDTSNTIANVAAKVTPSVVNVFSSRTAHPAAGREPFFDFFFGPRQGPRQAPGQGERQERSLGSGVIVSSDGLLLTNNHVVEGADSVRVALADGREFDAKVVGTDPPSDLAVLRIEASGLPPIAVGDSAHIRVGEIVLAVGNPFGVGQTVTMGIVSAVGRANTGIVDYEDFIQTDAAINPGNSGGALVNLRGELVGINTAIASRSGGYQGIGFAIPSQMAMTIKESLVEHGRVVRGWLGVAIQNVTSDLAEALGLTPGKGVLVGDVTKDSPADKAGIQREDVILSVDGVETNDMGRLRTLVATKGAGNMAHVSLLRQGRKVEVDVALAELPSDLGGTAGKITLDDKAAGRLRGLSLGALSRELRQKYGIPEGLDGVLVTGVDPRSPAASSGLREGDLVVRVNRQEVRSVRELRQQIDAAHRAAVLLVFRDGFTVYLTLRK